MTSLHLPDGRGFCKTCSLRMPCDWSVALDDMKRAAARIDELEASNNNKEILLEIRADRIAELERLLGFFAGYNPETGEAPSPADVLERAKASWEANETVPIEALTIVGCLSTWARQAREALGLR